SAVGRQERLDAVRASSRACVGGAKWLRLRHFLEVILELADLETSDHGPKLLGRLEHRNRPGGDFNWRARPRIPRHSRLAMADFEGAEPTHLDVLLSL